MRSKLCPSEYIALLTAKYDVEVERFFNALLTAVKNGKSQCGDLSIECREKKNNKVVLLITRESKVVAQFQLPEEFFKETGHSLREVKKARLSETPNNRKYDSPQPLQIKDLRIGMKKVNLKAKVVEVSKPTFVVTRFGNYANVANAMVSDDTGKIKLCLWNDQIKTISVGDMLLIENARIAAFRNEKQLRVGKTGFLHVTPPELNPIQN
jgi:replication factor A1